MIARSSQLQRVCSSQARTDVIAGETGELQVAVSVLQAAARTLRLGHVLQDGARGVADARPEFGLRPTRGCTVVRADVQRTTAPNVHPAERVVALLSAVAAAQLPVPSA